MARGGGLNLIGAAFNQAALAGVFVILARTLGRADLGIYAQAFAFLSLLSLVSLSGFRAGLTRFVAVHLARRDAAAMRGTVRLGLGLTTGFAVVLGASLCLLAPWLVEHAFHDPRLLAPLRYTAFILPAAAFTDAALSATQGFNTMKPYAVIGLVFEPAVRLSLTLAFVSSSLGLQGAMIALLVSHGTAAVLSARALRQLMGRPMTPPAYHTRELFDFSIVSWLAAIASNGLIWADTILLGIYRPSAEVGIYNVATRLVVLATFVMAPINASFAPRIADLYQRGHTGLLKRSYGMATGWILRLSLPAFVLLVVFPKELLLLFGAGFAVGATVTVVLAVGKLIDAATGPCGLMLNMSGRPALSLMDNIGALGVNIGLNIWLIPHYGILGSAVAWAVSLGLVNLVRVIQVWRTLGMLPFDVGVTKGLVAGSAAFAVGLAVRFGVAEPASLPVGAVTVGIVYIGLIAALGVTAEDRVVLQALVSRFRPGGWHRLARVEGRPSGGRSTDDSGTLW